MMKQKKIIGIVGGAGGVGKSFLLTNLAPLFVHWNKKVILADLNTEGACLHNMLGISFPEKTLADYFKKESVELSSLLIQTPYPSITLLSNSSSFVLSRKSYPLKKKNFIQELEQLSGDVLLLDAPSTRRELEEVVLQADVSAVVIDSMPSTIESNFMFLKGVVFRLLLNGYKKNIAIKKLIEEAFDPRSNLNLDTLSSLFESLEKLEPENTQKVKEEIEQIKIGLILNKVESDEDEDVVEPFQKLVNKYLGLKISYLGRISYFPQAKDSITKGIPATVSQPQSKLREELTTIAGRLL